MAVSLSGIATIGSDFSIAAPTPRPTDKPTESQEVHRLQLSGLSDQQIASSIPLPLSEVELTLGDTSIASSTQTSASALVALSARLSVSA
jgi:hypothetical protein